MNRWSQTALRWMGFGRRAQRTQSIKTLSWPLALLLVWLTAAVPGAWAEWSLAAYLGAARPQKTSLLVEQPGIGTQLRLREVEFIGDSLDSPLYYGYRVGYFFGRWLGLEAEFIHQKVIARVDRTVPVEGVLRGETIRSAAPMDSLVGQFSISHGLNLLLANVIFRRDFWREADGKLGRAVWTGRWGMGGTIPHPESEVLGVFQQQYQAGRPVLQGAGGFEYRLWGGWYGVGEYKYTRTRQRVRIAGGHAETLLDSHHAIFGLAYHF